MGEMHEGSVLVVAQQKFLLVFGVSTSIGFMRKNTLQEDLQEEACKKTGEARRKELSA